MAKNNPFLLRMKKSVLKFKNAFYIKRLARYKKCRRKVKKAIKKAETGDRTPDLPLTKRLLYQLSYLGNTTAINYV